MGDMPDPLDGVLEQPPLYRIVIDDKNVRVHGLPPVLWAYARKMTGRLENPVLRNVRILTKAEFAVCSENLPERFKRWALCSKTAFR
jgi:hypothetical protein